MIAHLIFSVALVAGTAGTSGTPLPAATSHRVLQVRAFGALPGQPSYEADFCRVYRYVGGAVKVRSVYSISSIIVGHEEVLQYLANGVFT